METNFIEKLKELTEQVDVLAVQSEVNELRSKFEDYILEQERQLQVRQLEAQEKDEEVPEADSDYGKEEFYSIYNEYKEKRKAAADLKKATEEKNLQEKKSLIKKLQDVITNEENIGAAFAAFKEVQESWKEIGDIPRDKRNEIQSEYSKLIEDFFYNIKIYKELKDHDLHRNSQLKNEIIQKLKHLTKVESIKEIEQQLKTLQNDWEDVGPVPNEEWEKLKDAYWTEVRSVYERINRFYEDRRSIQQKNIELKQALIQKIEEIVEKLSEFDSVKAWDQATEKVLKIQEEWKQIGFGPRKENETVWKEFRSRCDKFFDSKKEFFGTIQEQFDSIAQKKEELIKKAEELMHSKEWSSTSEALIKLQKQWKAIGHSGKRNEQKLWKQFRAACDVFFNARQSHFAEKDKEFEQNLVAKQALIEEIKAFKPEGDKKVVLETLKSFAQKFNELGMVPMKQKDKIYKDFKAALDEKYGALDLEKGERESAVFTAKIETLKASPDSRRQLSDLKNQLRKDIDKLKKDVILFENNLGFFANSKGADALKKEVEKKIEKANREIDAIKAKIKMIPNE